MTIDLACNDYRNGSFQGWVEDAFVHVGKDYDDGVEVNGDRVKVAELPGKQLKIGRVRVGVIRSVEWYGNWCWNSYEIRPEDVRSVVNYLRLRGWRCTCGPEELYDRFNEPGEITPEEWQKMIQELAK